MKEPISSWIIQKCYLINSLVFFIRLRAQAVFTRYTYKTSYQGLKRFVLPLTYAHIIILVFKMIYFMLNLIHQCLPLLVFSVACITKSVSYLIKHIFIIEIYIIIFSSRQTLFDFALNEKKCIQKYSSNSLIILVFSYHGDKPQ